MRIVCGSPHRDSIARLPFSPAWGSVGIVMADKIIAFVLICAANAIPLLAYDVFKHRGARPLDGRRRWPDGRPIFGNAKTIRGVALALGLVPALAFLLGFSPRLGLFIAAGAMAGDLFSSFCKRRLGMKSGSMAFGLDQIPESLLPYLAVRAPLNLTPADMALGVLLFVAVELVASRILFKVHLREHPY